MIRELTDRDKVARVTDLLVGLRDVAYAHWGSCATGIKDYRHSHAWASECSECVERKMAGKMIEKLEHALHIDPESVKCYLTDDGFWCVNHRREAKKCQERKRGI